MFPLFSRMQTVRNRFSSWHFSLWLKVMKELLLSPQLGVQKPHWTGLSLGWGFPGWVSGQVRGGEMGLTSQGGQAASLSPVWGGNNPEQCWLGPPWVHSAVFLSECTQTLHCPRAASPVNSSLCENDSLAQESSGSVFSLWSAQPWLSLASDSLLIAAPDSGRSGAPLPNVTWSSHAHTEAVGPREGAPPQLRPSSGCC